MQDFDLTFQNSLPALSKTLYPHFPWALCVIEQLSPRNTRWRGSCSSLVVKEVETWVNSQNKPNFVCTGLRMLPSRVLRSAFELDSSFCVFLDIQPALRGRLSVFGEFPSGVGRKWAQLPQLKLEEEKFPFLHLLALRYKHVA